MYCRGEAEELCRVGVRVVAWSPAAVAAPGRGPRHGSGLWRRSSARAKQGGTEFRVAHPVPAADHCVHGRAALLVVSAMAAWGVQPPYVAWDSWVLPRWVTPLAQVAASVLGPAIRPPSVIRILFSPCRLASFAHLTPCPRPRLLFHSCVGPLVIASPPTVAAVRRSLAVKVAVASGAVLLAVTAPVSAATSSCAGFTGHQVLSAPGGVLTLRDGRQVRASIIDVGGCTTRTNWVTGKAHRDTSSNYTTSSRGTTQSRDSASECVTGVPTKAGAANYTSFQAVVFEANGFQFTPSFVLEDVDAQGDAANPSEGWRETMSSLGAAGGKLVYPQLSMAEGALWACGALGCRPSRSRQLGCLLWRGCQSTGRPESVGLKR